VLGLIEGLTEFIPVSSTGHLVLLGHFLGAKDPADVFKILIQLGAILAILSVYSAKILSLLIDLPRDRRTQIFVLAVLIAFLPASVIGAAFHKHIKCLLEVPLVVCVSLIVGGVILLYADQMRLESRVHDVMDIGPLMAL